ncbi:MAG: hypothetical protein U1F63_12500 [Chitinivorax sp.]
MQVVVAVVLRVFLMLRTQGNFFNALRFERKRLAFSFGSPLRFWLPTSAIRVSVPAPPRSIAGLQSVSTVGQENLEGVVTGSASGGFNCGHSG